MTNVEKQEGSIRVSAGGLSLHALQRNPLGHPAVLFLHGWLDHGHSFDWVCDELPPSWRQIALDFRGMGHSAHLSGGGLYHFTDYLADVEGALVSLGIEAVHLVGHSLGGTVALFYAAAKPQRVLSVTTIESLGPSGGAGEATVKRLQGFVADLAKVRRKRTYPSVEAAAARVRENNSALSERVAFHLALYGTQPASSGGVEFTFDPAHRWRFGFGFDDEQVLAILGAVRAKVQVIHGSHGFTFDDGQMKAKLARLGSPTPVTVDGGHHVHMDRPKEVALHIERFIASNS